MKEHRNTIVSIGIAIFLIGGSLAYSNSCDAQCQAQQSVEEPTMERFGSLPAAAFNERLAGSTIIDVRTPEEFALGHIEGAVLIDFYSDTFKEQLATLDKSANYSLYCRSGNRSGQTLGIMEELGFENVYDLSGGVGSWSAAGYTLIN
jgi:rhodanese-related sulfurtransferase